MAPVASGQVYNWDTGEVIPGTEGVTPGPGMELEGWSSADHNLRYADFSGGLDLHDSSFQESWLDHAWFIGADLTGANFNVATLTGADLSGATVTGANFGRSYQYAGTGLTADQLYSTASYQASDLRGICLAYNDLTGCNFASQDLTDAALWGATLTDADFDGANVAGAMLADTTRRGFTAGQLYSTASYQAGDLHGIVLIINDLTGWDFSGKDLKNAFFVASTLTDAAFGGAVIEGAHLGNTTYGGFTSAQLYSTASYQTGNLQGIGLGHNDLSGWDFSRASLAGASFLESDLSEADFDDAIVSRANFGDTTSRGFTAEQLYSTASYRSRDLHAIVLGENDLTGWDFTDQNLTDAMFGGSSPSLPYLDRAILTDADLSRADTRGARRLSWSDAITENTILPDGHIVGLDLGAGETLRVRDYEGDIAITIDDQMLLDADATLEIIFADAEWGSTISLADSALADLDGTLLLSFTDDADLGSLVGTTFDLFDWNGGLLPGDALTSIDYPSWSQWDLSDLYLGGSVTLVAVPEPATLTLLALGILAIRWRR